MKRLAMVFCVLLCLASATALGDGEQAGRTEKARRMFNSAFRSWLKTEQRVIIMRNVARDFEDTRWGDDALWILSRVADMRNEPARAIVLRQQLLQRGNAPSLEEFTRKRPLFRASRIAQAEFLLERTGYLYRGKPGRARKVNVMPMILHEQLAAAYARLDMPKSAAREYARARKLAPPGGIMNKMYTRRMKEQKERARRNDRKSARKVANHGKDVTEDDSSRSEERTTEDQKEDSQ